MKHLNALAFRTGIVLVSVLLIGTCEKGGALQAQSEDKVLAVINGTKITQKQVDDTIISQVSPLEQQLYVMRKAALENLILTAILQEEAKKRRISLEELRKQLTAGKVEVSSTEVEKAYSENASVFGTMSPDEARERLRLDLESHAHMQLYRDAVSSLRASSEIEVFLDEPRLTALVNDNAPSLGSKQATITVVEFSDFQCPFCRSSQDTIKQVLRSYQKEIRLIFLHLPLEIHSEAFSAAQAAFCAGQQNAFWTFHDALFASEDFSTEALNKIASGLHLNMPVFADCIKSEAARNAILRDLNEAQRLGINSTPTFLINGRVFRGALSFQDFKAAIERELKAPARRLAQ